MSDRRIVVGVNGTESALRAARWGAEEADNRHLPLLLVHAYGVPDAFFGEAAPPRDWYEATHAQSRAWLAEAREAAVRARPMVEVATESSSDLPLRVLLARSAVARMMVIGSASRGLLGDLVLGAIAPPLAAHSHCPVAVVRGREPGPGEPVVVGIDGSASADIALELAFEEALLRGVELVALHAVLAEEDLIDDPSAAVIAWREKYPDVRVDPVTVRDDPRKQLLAWSERAQLVVVGSRGRGRFTGWLLGSTSQALIHHAGCPVVVARAEPGK
jgi:nucleotide-binding universal stress UspA family protein